MGISPALLEAYGAARTAAEAERALDALAAHGAPPELELGERYEELAAVAAEDGDHGLAARAQRKAIEHGCVNPWVAREMLAWYLLRDGQRVAGEFAFASMLAERGEDDVELQLTIAAARLDAGHHADALAAANAALAAARAHGNPEELARARAERWGQRQELGLEPDEDDLLAPKGHLDAPAGTALAVGWFPRDEQELAVERWPELERDLADPDAYCRAVELALRAPHDRRLALVPLRVAAVLEFARREALDPDDRATLARHAAHLAARGETLDWPPGRNEPCWCGSWRKYKRCCGAA